MLPEESENWHEPWPEHTVSGMAVGHALFGVMHTPFTHAPYKQSTLDVQPVAAVAAMVERDWQRTLLSPTIPVYP